MSGRACGAAKTRDGNVDAIPARPLAGAALGAGASGASHPGPPRPGSPGAERARQSGAVPASQWRPGRPRPPQLTGDGEASGPACRNDGLGGLTPSKMAE